MRHKAIAIFNQFDGMFKARKARNINNFRYSDYLSKEHYIDLVFNITGIISTFDQEEFAYIEVEIYSNVVEKDLIKFSINREGGMVLAEGFDEGSLPNPQGVWIDKLVKHLNLTHLFKQPISVMEIAPIPAGKWPYNFDHTSMGVSISKEWELMHRSIGEGKISNVVIIHLPTGRRFDLDLFEAEQPLVTIMTPDGPKPQSPNGTILPNIHNAAVVEKEPVAE